MAAFFCPQTEELSGQHWYGISYLRLSKLGKRYESESIDNQRKLIHEFVQRHPEITLVGERVDDGYTGTNYDRPGFQGVMDAIREKKANCVIVKDLSRLGREYIETGKYLETVFPDMGIRFISVNDDLDSEHTPLCDDISIPIKNIMNEAYCRSLSQKLRAQFRVQRKAGEFLGAFACYGYLKDPADKHKLIIDEYAAMVVRTIFQLKMEGYSQQAIANYLSSEGVLPPAAYKQQQGLKYQSGFQAVGDNNAWSPVAVRAILENPIYIGTLVQGKRGTPNYKIKQMKLRSKEDWCVVEKNHAPIISEELFTSVQHLLSLDTRTSPSEEVVQPLAGMLYCADCGEKLYYSVTNNYKREQAYFFCSSYRKNSEVCSAHYIREKVVEQIVLESMQRILLNVQAFEKEFARKQMDCYTEDKKKQLAAKCRELSKAKKRIAEIDALIQKIYEDNASGKLSDERYATLSLSYEEEQKTLKAAVLEMQAYLETETDKTESLQRFIQKVKQITELKALTPELIHEFVDKIVVYAPRYLDGKRVQLLDIYYSGVGILHELTPEEMEEAFQHHLAERSKEKTA